MIESPVEFVDKLLEYFSKDSVSVEVTDGLKSYLRRHKFNSIELERLYSIVQENCNRFPVVQVVVKLWKDHGERYENSGGSEDRAISKFKNTGWKHVIECIHSVRKAQDFRELSNNEIDLLHSYDELSFVWGLLESVPPLVMDKEAKDIYMRKVKEDVDNNVPINRTKVVEAIKKRHDQYNAMYADQETEEAEKISKSVDDMCKAFGEKKKLLEPEPDKSIDFDFVE